MHIVLNILCLSKVLWLFEMRKKYFSYSKFWVTGLCIVMSLLYFSHRKKKKQIQLQLTGKSLSRAFFFFLSQNIKIYLDDRHKTIIMVIQAIALPSAMSFFSFPLGLFKKQSNHLTGESSLEEGYITQKDQYFSWQRNSAM